MDESPLSSEGVLESKEFVERVSRRLSGDRHGAEDLAQEVWIAALRASPPSGERRNRWLAGVARNLANGNLRAHGRRSAAEHLYVQRDAEPAPLEGLALESVRSSVRSAVERLREPYRSAIRMHFYDELDAHGIAETLGVPVETVRTRLKRGLALLAEDITRSSDDRRRSWMEGVLALFRPNRDWVRLRFASAVAAVTLFAVALWRHPTAAPAPVDESASLVQRSDENSVSLAGMGAQGRRESVIFVPGSGAPLLAPPVMRLSGTVVGPGGRAAPGAWVRAWSHSPERVEGALPQAEFETWADGDGRFRLDGLPLDTWAYAEHSALIGQEVLHAVVDSPREVEALALRLDAARTIRGRILDPAGRPVSGATVLLQGSAARTTAKRTEQPGITFIRQLAARVESDERGEFTLRESCDGVTSLRISHAGFLPAERLVGSGEAFVEVQLLRGQKLIVLVTDPEGRPVPDACVRGFGPTVGLRETRTDGSGRATLGDVPLPASLCWSVEAPGWARGLLEWRTYDLDGGPVLLSLAHARALEGRVVDERGARVAGARLAAFAQRLQAAPDGTDNDNQVAAQDLDRVGECKSDDSGAFAFDELPRHPLRLDVQGPRAGTSSLSLEVAADAKELVVALDASKYEGVRLRGVVSDAKTLAPLSTGLVRAFEGQGPMRTVSCRLDGNGGYDLRVPPGGPWTLCFSAPDHAPRLEVFAPGSTRERRDVELCPARTLELLMTDAHGQPLSQGVLLLHDERGAPVPASANAQAARSRRALGFDGRVLLTGLPAAPVVVTLLPAGLGAPQSKRFDLSTPLCGEVQWALDGLDVTAAERALVLEFHEALDARRWFVGEATVELRNRDDRVTHAWRFRATADACRLDPEWTEGTLKLDEKGEPKAYFERSLAATEWHALARAHDFDARLPRFSLRVPPDEYRLRVLGSDGILEWSVNALGPSGPSLSILLPADGGDLSAGRLEFQDR